MHEDGVRFCPNDGTPLTETSALTGQPTPTGQPPRSKELDLPVVVGQRYRLTEYRGGGGMAKVYKAVDVTLDREIAVKLINQELRSEPEFDARFQREARIASQLSDPHIVEVHDFGLDAVYGPYLVMQYLQGQSLRERLAATGRLPLKAGLQLSAQLMLALIHAHGKNIVHRDIKPDNIFLSDQSGVRLHVRVLDFGIARILRRDAVPSAPGGELTLTSPGAVLGTPRYMSPEQLAGQPLDARSDIYSAALVIHEALTGQLPYVSGKKLTELCPEATPAMQELLEHCLKPSPADRPPSTVEVYLRLQELGKASGILLLPPGAMDELLKRRKSDQTVKSAPAGDPTVAYAGADKPKRAQGVRRSVLLWGGLLLALAALAAAVKLLFFSSPPPPPEGVLGVKLGDAEDDVKARLKLNEYTVQLPAWEGKDRPAYLGHVLKKEDLGLGDKELEQLKVRMSANGLTCVLFHEGKVKALVTTDPAAASPQGVHVNDPMARLLEVYKEQLEQMPLGPRGSHVRGWRYDAAGIGFDVEDGKTVKSVTLYPPIKDKHD
jgi:serine/threonine protein kinase